MHPALASSHTPLQTLACVLRTARSHLRSHLLRGRVQVLFRQVILSFSHYKELQTSTVYIEQLADDMLSTTKGHFPVNNR